MNNEQALALAKRCVNAWRGGASLQDWVDVLDPLDEGTAGTAYIRLMNESDHGTPAAFVKIYDRLVTASTAPPRQDECPLGRCPGDGYRSTEFRVGKRTYPGVVPCDCPAGHARERVHGSVVTSRRP